MTCDFLHIRCEVEACRESASTVVLNGEHSAKVCRGHESAPRCNVCIKFQPVADGPRDIYDKDCLWAAADEFQCSPCWNLTHEPSDVMAEFWPS